jgi:hypothetical protein
MRIPIVRGTIERRLLVNYRVDPVVLAKLLPAPFRPKLAHGHGIAGICLIRLSGIRPRWLPARWGTTSENAAHRIAVEWDEGDTAKEGVYILRRDSGSRLNAWLGGRLFPGVHGRASFAVDESGGRYEILVATAAEARLVSVRGRVRDALPVGSIFRSLAEASAFFAGGSVGYSPARKPGHLDGLRLASEVWQVEPLEIDECRSAWLDDPAIFPAGSAVHDCTLLMRDIPHEWHAAPPLACACAA